MLKSFEELDQSITELTTEVKKLEVMNSDLLSGLYYAATVQQGLLPQSRHFEQLGYPYFLIYKPLNIVGGDFYWVGTKDETDYFIVGDCTGHGFAGGILSALAIGMINYLVYSKEFLTVGSILNDMDRKWIEAFSRNNNGQLSNNDWLEISICSFNNKTKELQFAGARGNLYLIRSGQEPLLINGNNYPIGGWQIEKERSYTTHFLSDCQNAMLYFFSDGYKDQFGGIKNKRMGLKNFLSLLNSNAGLPLNHQKTNILEFYERWKGINHTLDDVTIMGIRV